MGLQLSIHGRDKNGKQHTEPYNKNPQPPKAPSTARGKRRLENKGSKHKTANKSAKGGGW